MISDKCVDVVLLTALPLERAALLKYTGTLEESRAKGRVYHRGMIGQYDIVVWCAGGMGNITAARATTEAIGIWNPAHIILIGYAGGLQKNNERFLGDVLVADQVVDYELAKDKPDRLERRYQVYRPAKVLIDAAKDLDPSAWAMSIAASRPDGETGRVVPKVHFGSVASGQKVVTNPESVQELKTDWAELIGIEMEGVGVALSAYESENTPGFLLVKGVSDWADPLKHDGWQQYAAEAAAAFTVALLKEGPIKSHKSHTRVQAVPRNRQIHFGGKAKINVCRRLTEDWQDLADYFAIPKYDREKFEKGRGPAGVWEWLEARGKLSFLSEGLEAIQRQDLLQEITANPQ